MTLSNTIYLWTLTTEFLDMFNIHVYLSAFLRCRVNYFTQNTSRAISTYLAIAITFDRLIRSELPIRSRIICTRRNAIKLTLAYLIIFSFLHSFWFCPLNTIHPTIGICYTGQSFAYNYFYNNIFLPFRLIIICIIPIITMNLANFRMLLNLRESRRRVQQGTEINSINGGLRGRRTTPLDRTLLHLMLVNVGTFILTQIPFHIYALVEVSSPMFTIYTSILIRTFMLIWSSIYFGIGFYFYCLASPLFRKKFILINEKVINCIRRRPPPA